MRATAFRAAPGAVPDRAWLPDAALPLWLGTGFDPGSGLFHDALDGRGRALPGHFRARVQARQIFVTARAGALGWAGDWRGPLQAGLHALLGQMRRPDGWIRYSLPGGGMAGDDRADSYEQAFALFALAHAHAALGDPALEAEALGLLGRLRAARQAGPGIGEAPGAPVPCLANSQMHLLEAALAWRASGSTPEWSRLSDDLAALCLTRLIGPGGAVLEYFDRGWRAVGTAAPPVEPGHQFEWASLLEAWRRAAGRARPSAIEGLMAAGRRGVDPARNVAIGGVSRDAAPMDRTARLWPQTERLRAERLLGTAGDVAMAEAGLAAYFRDMPPGLWRETMDADGRFRDEPVKASSLYHILGAIG